MAEIKITKKAPVWPWILIILIVIAGIFFLFFYGDTDEDDVINTTDELENVTFTEIQPIFSVKQLNV